MAIMQSCCCWSSVRRGSFACAVYTAFYYSIIAVTIATVLQEESQYLSGNRSLPKSNSLLEPGVSPITMRFNITLLICSSCGVISCLLLLYGLFKDEKLFLVPWICIVIVCCFVDISHLIYLFFIVSIYSVLCVIAQYQEYAAGRGTALDDCEQRVPAVRYTVQPTTTATSCLSSRRIPTNSEIRMTPTTTTTSSQSPTTFSKQLIIERSPTNDKPNRKHVQFPDTASASLLHDRADEAVTDQLKTIVVNPKMESELHSE